MLQRHESYSFLPIPFGIALCGLAFCAWNLWSADTVPCLSSGCTLFQDFTIAGLSLWWLGLAGFAALFACALAGRLSLGRICAAVGVFLDCVLLALMLTASPCLPCLGAGLLLAATYVFFVQAAMQRQRSFSGWRFSPLLALWGCLFIANFGGFAHDATSPWVLKAASSGDTAIRAFFSPSCPACRQLVRELPPAQADKVNWLPVAEQEHDLRVIGAMLPRLRNGESLADALPAALENPLAGKWVLLQPEILMLQLRLWRNHAHVMRNGGTLPLLEFSGLPTFMLSPRGGSAQRPAALSGTGRGSLPSGGQSHELPVDLGIAGGCEQRSGEQCE